MIVKKTIDEIVFKANYLGIGYWNDLYTQCLDETKSYILQSELTAILLDKILVEPKMDIDDFDSIEQLDKVRSFLIKVAKGDYQQKLTKGQLKQRARDNWAMWRLVLSDGGFDYKTVFGKDQMTQQDILEANYALDMQIEATKKQMKKK